MGEYLRRRRDLYKALYTRVLSDSEMDEVMREDWHITTEDMVPYNELEKRREFHDAIAQQYRLRRIAQGKE